MKPYLSISYWHLYWHLVSGIYKRPTFGYQVFGTTINFLPKFGLKKVFPNLVPDKSISESNKYISKKIFASRIFFCQSVYIIYFWILFQTKIFPNLMVCSGQKLVSGCNYLSTYQKKNSLFGKCKTLQWLRIKVWNICFFLPLFPQNNQKINFSLRWSRKSAQRSGNN